MSGRFVRLSKMMLAAAAVTALAACSSGGGERDVAVESVKRTLIETGFSKIAFRSAQWSAGRLVLDGVTAEMPDGNRMTIRSFAIDGADVKPMLAKWNGTSGIRHEWLKRPFSLPVSIRSNPGIDNHQLREHKVNMKGFNSA